MSKITRQTFVQFGVNVNAAADICEFGTPATGSPVYTATISTLQANSAWTTGWAAETISSNRPFLEDMNAVCYVFSYMLAYLMEMGIPEYDASTTYYTNSIVQYSGTLYQSLADSNIGNTPTVGSYWKLAIPAISGILGTWVSKSVNTIYQAATDGFVTCTVLSQGGTNPVASILTDSNSTPSTTRVYGIGYGPYDVLPSVTSPVKKGDYYECVVSAAATSSAFFIPMGS